jgi:uncharacterized damage-inducible protein DinB
MHELFLRFSGDKLRQLAGRIDVCLNKLNHDQIWWRGAETQNAVGNLVLHLAGNVRQWIISSVGGEPDVRKRDEEFAAREGMARDELSARLRETVEEATTIIAALSEKRLQERVRIQSYEVTVLEAVYHVVEHFAQHTGQVMYATKLLTSEDLGFYKHLNKPAHVEKTP